MILTHPPVQTILETEDHSYPAGQNNASMQSNIMQPTAVGPSNPGHEKSSPDSNQDRNCKMSMSTIYHATDSHLDYHPHRRRREICRSSPKIDNRVNSLDLKTVLLIHLMKLKNQNKFCKFHHTTSLSIRPFLSLNFVNLLACSGEILCREKYNYVP